MSTLGEISTAIDKIDTHKILIKVLKQSNIQNFIKDMIHDRIYSHGITGTGVKLKTDKAKSGHVYSTFTETIKESVGDPFNRVTLTDTGRMWDTLKILIKEHSFITELNLQKGSDNVFDNFTNQFSSEKAFHDAVTSLSDNEMVMLIEEYIAPNFMKILNEIL